MSYYYQYNFSLLRYLINPLDETHTFFKFVLILDRDAADKINFSELSNDSEPVASKYSNKKQVRRKLVSKRVIKAREIPDTSSSDEESLQREVIASTGKN